MTLHLVRRIRDNLHGSIDITELEDVVLAHPFFQRLRRVRQLAFLHYVFPGATHTRFEHSLGVMHLSSMAWEKLRANQARLKQTLERYPDFGKIEESEAPLHGRIAPTFALLEQIFQSDSIYQVFRLAALLHDLGHPPFSHSGEHFMPNWQEVLSENQDLPDYLRQYLASKIQELKNQGKDPARLGVRHEIYSVLLIDRLLRDLQTTSAYQNLPIQTRDVVSLINPQILPEPNSILYRSGAYQLLRELISGELDTDRMDYLLRDSRECGVVYGVFDVDRILDSLSVYYDDNDKSLHVAILLSGLAAFEDYLRARYSMYLQLYFHKSSVAAEAMMCYLTERLQSWRIPARLDRYAAFDEYNIGQALYETAMKNQSHADRDRDIVLIADLLYNRRLWKRVYEISGPAVAIDPAQLAIIEGLLQERQVAYQIVSSGNSLTRFQPKNSGRSHNYLRLIKKDDKQRPRVLAIEDFSSLIASNDSMAIHRIYAEPNANWSASALRQVITDALSMV